MSNRLQLCGMCHWWSVASHQGEKDGVVNVVKCMVFTFNGTDCVATEAQTIPGFDDQIPPVWAQRAAEWVPSQD